MPGPLTNVFLCVHIKGEEGPFNAGLPLTLEVHAIFTDLHKARTHLASSGGFILKVLRQSPAGSLIPVL